MGMGATRKDIGLPAGQLTIERRYCGYVVPEIGTRSRCVHSVYEFIALWKEGRDADRDDTTQQRIQLFAMDERARIRSLLGHELAQHESERLDVGQSEFCEAAWIHRRQ